MIEKGVRLIDLRRYLHFGCFWRFLSTSWSVSASFLLFNDLFVLRLFFWNWLGFGRQGLQELSWLRFLVASHVGDLELLLGKCDAETSANPLAARSLCAVFGNRLTSYFILFLVFHRYFPADELVLLVQERHSRLDDLASLESFGEIGLESIEGDSPILPDLIETEVDDLPDAGAHTDLDEAGLVLEVLLGHELRLVLQLLLLLLGLLAALVFGARGSGLLRRSCCVRLVRRRLSKLVVL